MNITYVREHFLSNWISENEKIKDVFCAEASIDFMGSNCEWINRNRNKFLRHLQIFKNTDFKPNEINYNLSKKFTRFFLKYSKIFSQVIHKNLIDISIESKKRCIVVTVPKIHLIMMSEKFRGILGNEFNRSSLNSVLLIKEVDLEEHILYFLEFFKTGKSLITEYNVQGLLCLANKYIVESLKKLCLKFIQNNICIDDLVILFEMSASHDLPSNSR